MLLSINDFSIDSTGMKTVCWIPRSNAKPMHSSSNVAMNDKNQSMDPSSTGSMSMKTAFSPPMKLLNSAPFSNQIDQDEEEPLVDLVDHVGHDNQATMDGSPGKLPDFRTDEDVPEAAFYRAMLFL